MVKRERVEHRWVQIPINKEKSKQLQSELKIHPILCDILVQKGVDTFEKAQRFFRPTLNELHDPFLMKDMNAALARLDRAIAENERILIYGDYDVDGTTAVSLLYLFLNQFYENIDFYVPDRQSEGYGVSLEGIKYAEAQNCTLMIALDCGIKANSQVDYAKQKGIDFIICDHHTPGPELPKAVAVLDPKRTDCNYPNDELSGCGIGFKLCQAYAIEHGMEEEYLFQFLDLLAVSIACDIVPIVGENRILAKAGLEVLNTNPSAGLKSLMTLVENFEDSTYDITDVVFKIGPRINAAGRMAHAKGAVQVLLNQIPVDNLQKNNTARKEMDKNITEEALQYIENDDLELNKVTTVVFNENWHKGVIGIVASRLTEYYYRPTVVFSESDGWLTGSARSVKNFNIYEPLAACKELFDRFGGHAFAAGLTIKKENLEKFKIKFEEEVRARITDKELVPELEISADITIPDVSQRFMNILNQFEPFGPENMKPLFRLRNVRDAGYTKIVGDNHLKLHVKDAQGNKIKGIAFKMGDCLDLVKQGPVDLVGYLVENHWNGRTSIELMTKDIKFAEN